MHDFSFNVLYDHRLFTLYPIAFAPARKPYRTGVLFKHKNGDFEAISVTERSRAAPILIFEKKKNGWTAVMPRAWSAFCLKLAVKWLWSRANKLSYINSVNSVKNISRTNVSFYKFPGRILNLTNKDIVKSHAVPLGELGRK